MPATISQFTLPVRNATTGEIENITYDLPGSSTPEGNGFGYGTCSTAYITSAKEVSISSFVLKANGIVSITFANAVASSATLNINSSGAKAIYHRGAAIANNIIMQGGEFINLCVILIFTIFDIPRTCTETNNRKTNCAD